jgi:hypothetical protein
MAIHQTGSGDKLSYNAGNNNVTSTLRGTMANKQQTADQVKGWKDIDAKYKDDEFSCSSLAPGIFKYYRQREAKFQTSNYLAKNQPFITRHSRMSLVDWMVEVQQQLAFSHEILYLSVKLVDLYLNNSSDVKRDQLQLLAATAMFVSCKFEKRTTPSIDDFISTSVDAFTRNQLIDMEIDLLATIKFDLGAPLSYTYLRRYGKCVRANMKLLTLARYILELSLEDYQFTCESDSLKACAALYLAVKMAFAWETNGPANLTESLTSTEWVFMDDIIYFGGFGTRYPFFEAFRFFFKCIFLM